MTSGTKEFQEDGERLASPRNFPCITAKSSSTPLPAAQSPSRIPEPGSQFDRKHHPVEYPRELLPLLKGMPSKLQSQPTQKNTVTAKATPSSPTSNDNGKKDSVLRSGKWTPEEELYANILIELFKEGRVDEFENNMDSNDNHTNEEDRQEGFKVVNGMTLRNYLSRKLFCSPMRISKKFAGKGIGKLVYLNKRSVNYQRLKFPFSGEMHFRIQNSFSSNLDRIRMNRLKETESNFLRQVFPNRSSPKTKRKSVNQSSRIGNEDSPSSKRRMENAYKDSTMSPNNPSDVSVYQSRWDSNQYLHQQQVWKQNGSSDSGVSRHSPQQYTANKIYPPIAPFPTNGLQQQQEQPCNNQGQILDSNYGRTILPLYNTDRDASTATSSPNPFRCHHHQQEQRQPSPLMTAPILLAPASPANKQSTDSVIAISQPRMEQNQRVQDQQQSHIEILRKAYYSSVSPTKTRVAENIKRQNVCFGSSPIVPRQLAPQNEIRGDSGIPFRKYDDPIQKPSPGQDGSTMMSQDGNHDTGNSIESRLNSAKDNDVGNSQSSILLGNAPGQIVNSPPRTDINVPTFLSDFHEISKQQSRSTSNGNTQNDTVCDLQIAQISPAYHRSKSFDHFHRYLGKGLSPPIVPPPTFPKLQATSAGPAIPSIRSSNNESVSKLHLRRRTPNMQDIAPSPIGVTNSMSKSWPQMGKNAGEDHLLGENYTEARGNDESQQLGQYNAFTRNLTSAVVQQEVFPMQGMNQGHPCPTKNHIQKQHNSNETSDFLIEGMVFEDFEPLGPFTSGITNSSSFSSEAA